MEENKTKELEMRIAELEAYVAERKQQQLTYPLDGTSRTIVQEGAVYGVSTLVAGAPATNGHIVVSWNGKSYKLMTTA